MCDCDGDVSHISASDEFRRMPKNHASGVDKVCRAEEEVETSVAHSDVEQGGKPMGLQRLALGGRKCWCMLCRCKVRHPAPHQIFCWPARVLQVARA